MPCGTVDAPNGSSGSAPVSHAAIDPGSTHSAEFVTRLIHVAASFALQIRTLVVYPSFRPAAFQPHATKSAEPVGLPIISSTEATNHN